MIGSKDLQVPAEINQLVIARALERGGNEQYRIKTLTGLNHLFQNCKTGSPSEYAAIEETMAPKALLEIVKWIRQIVSSD